MTTRGGTAIFSFVCLFVGVPGAPAAILFYSFLTANTEARPSSPLACYFDDDEKASSVACGRTIYARCLF